MFASLAPFSHFETMFIHWFVIAQQLSLVYCCESPAGAEDSLRFCSAFTEGQTSVLECCTEKLYKICDLGDFYNLYLSLRNLSL